MRKIIIFALAALFSVSVFALESEDYSKNFEAEDVFSNEFWITNRNIGLGVPIIIQNSASENEEKKSIGFNWSYKEQHIYWPNGYTFQFEAAQGILKKNNKIVIEDNFQIGFGYAFASDRKRVITLAGIIGSYDSIAYGNNLFNFDMDSVLTFIIGLDFSATFRFSEHLGFFISALVETPLIGFEQKIYISDENGWPIAKKDFHMLIPGDYWYIKPSIGLSLTFGE